MSRRDTIIIALLINGCLLALLFFLAINTNEEDTVDHLKTIPLASRSIETIEIAPSHEPMLLAETHPENDEVDHLLKNLVSSNFVQSIHLDQESFEFEKTSEGIAKNVDLAKGTLSSEENYVEVTVKRGDALEKIARSNGTTIEAIKKANSLTSAKLIIGQVLRVPVSSKNEKEVVKRETEPTAISKPSQVVSLPSSREAEKKVVVEDYQYYTMKNGDSPWKIAKQYNVKFEELLKLNGLDEEKARHLKIGDKIRVR